MLLNTAKYSGKFVSVSFLVSFPLLDNFTLYYDTNPSNPVPFDDNGISWKSDRETKFKNPSDPSLFNKYAKPKDWQKPISDFENKMQNEDFIVWMRVAAFPTFRKLYRKLDRESTINGYYKDGMKSGAYTLEIGYSMLFYLVLNSSLPLFGRSHTQPTKLQKKQCQGVYLGCIKIAY